MIVYIYNIGVDLYNGFNGLRHRINWTYFTVLDGLAHPLYSINFIKFIYFSKKKYNIEYVLTILSFSNHKLKDILIGQQPYDSLEDFVKGKQQKKEFSFFF